MQSSYKQKFKSEPHATVYKRTGVICKRVSGYVRYDWLALEFVDLMRLFIVMSVIVYVKVKVTL
jgi:hypothetical protein